MNHIERLPYVLMLIALVIRLIGPIMMEMALARFLRLTKGDMRFARKIRLLSRATIFESLAIIVVIVSLILTGTRPAIALYIIAAAYAIVGAVYARLARMIDTGNSKG